MKLLPLARILYIAVFACYVDADPILSSISNKKIIRRNRQQLTFLFRSPRSNAHAIDNIFLSLRAGGSAESLASARQKLPLMQKKPFVNFQKKYLFGHLLATYADFLQGAYLYKIYDMYGFSMGTIAMFYVGGFLSSLVASLFAGTFTDRVGRRSGSLAFAVLQALSCILIRYKNSFTLLLLGRIASGVGYSFLATSFECWMVSEHFSRGFPDWALGSTFSLLVIGMGLTAVFAGISAGALVDRGFGILAPFNLCTAVCGATAIYLLLAWNENYGARSGSSKQASLEASVQNQVQQQQQQQVIDHPEGAATGGTATPVTTTPPPPKSPSPSPPPPRSRSLFAEAVHEIFTNRCTLLTGLIQSLYEAAMLTFVFIWTPVLEDCAAKAAKAATTAAAASAPVGLNLGTAFSSFMVSMMVGSAAYQALTSQAGRCRLKEGKVFLSALLLAAGSLALAAFWPQLAPMVPGSVLGKIGLGGGAGAGLLWPTFASFLVFEFTVGVYFPSIGGMRAKHIKESVRGTVMNLFRLVLNGIVVGMLVGPVNNNSWGFDTKRTVVLGIASGMVALAAVLQGLVLAVDGKNGKDGKDGKDKSSSVAAI